MNDAWFNEHRVQLLGAVESLFVEARTNATQVQDSERIQGLLQQAEQQYTATEDALRTLSQQRQTLMHTLEQLQAELAIAGRPITGEIS